MSTTTDLQLTPGILSVLPLFYVGWSDSVLSPSEMKIIHKKLKDFTFLTKEDKSYLIKYSNPKTPPSEQLFKDWLEIIRDQSDKIPKGQRQTLAEVGIELAKASIDYKNDELWKSPKVKAALIEIEKELGVYNNEGLQTMILQIDNKKITGKQKKVSFEPQKMRVILDGKYHQSKKRMRKLLRDPVFKLENIRDKEAQRARVLDQLAEIAKQGLGGLAFPTKYGGQDNMGGYMSVFETLACHNLSLTIKFGVQFGLFGGAIYGLGTDQHHKKYLEDVGNAKLLGCFAMTETGHGSNVKSLETTATYNKKEDTIIINSPTESSGKEFIGNTIHGTLAVVFAQLLVDGENHGIHAVLVPYRGKDGKVFKDIRVEDCGYKLGLNGVDNGRLWFNSIAVPRENLLNKYGGIDDEGTYISPIKSQNKRFFTMLGALVGGRICVGLAGLNAANTALTIAIKYGIKRRQFESVEGEKEFLIMDYPSHQRRLVPKLIKGYAYKNALTNLLVEFSSNPGADRRKIETKAAGLKALATWHATETIQECREACGGKGYLSENKFGDLKADSDIFTTFEGDNTVLMQLVAKGLLTEFKQSFHDEGFTSVLKYVLSKVSFSLAEYNPLYTRNTSLDHLMSDDFHAEAFKYREKKILMSLSERMRDYIKKRMSPFDAFLKCQNHMIELAKAYIERLTYKEWRSSINDLPIGNERDILDKMCKFYALYSLEENKGWYLENDYMDGSKTKAIRRLINKLLQEFRPDLEAMVDSFGIPEESLSAAIILDKS